MYVEVVQKCVYIVLLILFLVVPTKHALHMFQQNRYEFQRYTEWIQETLKRNFVSKALPFIVSFVVLLILKVCAQESIYMVVSLCILGIWTFYMLYQESKKTYIKPIVYTDRVKRQIAVMGLLDGFVLYCVCNYCPFPDTMYIVIPLVYVMNWIMVYVMAAITNPIEAMVKQSYVNKAKKILKDHSDLIKIGITGSYGKTSSKNILQAILSENYNSLMTPASFNTPMGITITIREKLKPIHEVFICEMGADHVGDISYLCKFVEPSIGVVTSVGPQHLNTFGSLDNIIREKMEMIETLPKDGLGIINADNEYIRNYKIKNTCRIVSYGIKAESATYKATNIQYSPQGSTFTVVNEKNEYPFETKLLGEHNILNILASIAVARELGVEWKQLMTSVKKVQYVEHRLEVKKINGYTFIDNAFNSNPVGSAMSLQVMKMMPNKRFVVTPGMIDLGKEQDSINEEFGKKMKDSVDTVILVGEQQTKPILKGLQEVKFNEKEIYVCKTVKEAFGLVYQLATPQDTILLENDLPDAFNQ